MHSIALQIPKSQLDNGSNHVVGIWSATDRQQVSVRNGKAHGGWVQVSRIGNPLINEVVIPTNLKDHWNATSPAQDKQFEKYYSSPILAAVLQKLYPQFGPYKQTGRTDLVAVLGTGLASPKLNYTGPTFADELRLNLSIPPTPANKVSNLGVIGGDLAGYPNGRRLNDDVIDISERVVAGELIGHKLPLGDGVDGNDVKNLNVFPYVAGSVQRLRRHARRPQPEALVGMRARVLIAGTAAVLTAAVLALGGAFRSGGAAAAPDRLPAGVAEELQRGFAAGDTEAEIAGLQGELRLQPRDVKALETLGLAYLQRVRETGDASYYPKADGILHEALGVAAARPDRDRRPRPARARPPPVSPGARARPPRAGDLADDRRRLRRDRRRRASSSAATRRRSPRSTG